MAKGALETIKQTIEEHRLIAPGAWVVVGFSGGPDSMCLLHCLGRLASHMDFKLYGVHINHRLRGAAADKDEAAAEQFCREAKIPFRSFHFDVAAMASEEGLSTEDAGRRVRYRAFEEVRRSLGEPAVIAVAQNADDQAETVLMRLMRGTGSRGLGAMDYRREDGVIRPLLNVTRKEVEAYCAEQGLEPCIDLTNLEPDYTRNRIRLELLPYMEKHFNPNVIESLRRLADTAREETSFIDDGAKKLLGQAMERQGTDEVFFPRKLLGEQHPALRHRAVLQLFFEAGLDKNIGAVHLRAADQLILHQSPGAVAEFPEGYRMTLSGDRIRIKGPGQGKSLEKEPPQERYRLQIEKIKKAELGNPKGLSWDVRAFDRAALEASGFSPVLRSRRPGDFLRPLGGLGSKKIQDFFVDRKVPRELRDSVPLVCLGSEVLWVAADSREISGGGTISETYRVREDTEEVLLFRILPKELR